MALSARQHQVVAKFLSEHPEFVRIDWTHQFGVDAFYADNPDEPMTVTEFVPGSATRVLLEDLEGELDLIDAQTPSRGVKR